MNVLRLLSLSVQASRKYLAVGCLVAALPMAAQNSPYISRVWEYVPAPGQFVNTIPAYEEGDNAEDMRAKAEERIADNAQGLICLGGWGGYVVFSFDHPVVNVAGQYDFIVEGNAFEGASEAGIVMVSIDANGNGMPDDEWYELAGSEYTNPLTRHNYSVTYERTPDDHQPTPDSDQKYRTDTTYIHWTDNEGKDGYIEKNTYHKQAYYPEWIQADRLTFTGARLPDNYVFENNKYILRAFSYGYADNHPDTAPEAQLNIDWAVRADGTPVHLSAIDFVKVYTALHQQCGMIGETSTEVKGARDLHPEAMPTGTVSVESEHAGAESRKVIRDGQLFIIHNEHIYNPLGYKQSIINN